MALILHNQTHHLAQFRLRQAEGLTGSFFVEPRGNAELVLEARYTLQVSGTLDDVRYEASLDLEHPREHLLAVRRCGEGQAPFELLRQPERAGSGITVENVLPAGLTFRIARLRPPLSTQVVLEQWQSHRFTLADVYEVRAIVEGYLTEPVRLDDPNVEVAATRDRETKTYVLQVVG